MQENENKLGFEKTTLGEIAPNITSGSRGWASFYSDDGALFLRMTNLPKNGIGLLLHNNKYVKLPTGSSEGKRTRVKKNDILVSITAELGKIGFVETDLGAAGNRSAQEAGEKAEAAKARPHAKTADGRVAGEGGGRVNEKF